MVLIGNLNLKASTGDSTVNGLPVSIRALTDPYKRGERATKETNGKYLPSKNFVQWQEILVKSLTDL